jgi:hypothetical protein
VSFGDTAEMSNDNVETLIGQAIAQSQALTKVGFPQSKRIDHLTLMATALANPPILFHWFLIQRDLWVFEIAAYALQASRSM